MFNILYIYSHRQVQLITMILAFDSFSLVVAIGKYLMYTAHTKTMYLPRLTNSFLQIHIYLIRTFSFIETDASRISCGCKR